MGIVDILRSAAWYLGVLDKLDAYLDEEDDEWYTLAHDLLRAFNNVEKQLALEYLPLYEKEYFETETGEICFDFAWLNL